jgi:predicted Zn finger-like uncharacterized protein
VQANCPKCNHRIAVDDAKAPDRPFNVRCPKCQNAVHFPGKAAAAAPEPAPGQASGGPVASAGEKALVALPDPALAGGVSQCLARLGYAVETLQDLEEGARLLEQGIFSVVVTSRAAAPESGESLYQRINRLPTEARRKVFLVLAGNEFQTGNGTQAFAVLADLVVHASNVGSFDGTLRNTLGERTRLYQAFRDAQKRYEASS